MSFYKVREVTNKSDFKKFILFPYSHYKKNKFWVPPLISEEKKFYNPKKNAFYKHAKVTLWLCEKDNEIVGRLSTNINYRFNEFQKQDNIGFWGSFETINDKKVVEELFDKTKVFFQENNIDTIRGPFTFSTNEISGLLTDNFDSFPIIMMPYNYEYYENLLLETGHEKCKDLWAYYYTKSDYQNILKRDTSKIKKKYEITVKKINFKKLKSEINILLDIYNKAWEKNWGFVPMTEEEFIHMATDLKTIVPEECVLIAYYKGLPAGFICILLDYNMILKDLNGKLFPMGIFKLLMRKKKINVGRTVLLGIDNKYRNKGIDIILIQEAIKLNQSRFSAGCELSWVLENNFKLNRVLQSFGNKPYKNYRIFEKQI